MARGNVVFQSGHKSRLLQESRLTDRKQDERMIDHFCKVIRYLTQVYMLYNRMLVQQLLEGI